MTLPDPSEESQFMAFINSVLSFSPVWLFETPWTAARQASLSITNSQSLLKFISIESVMPSNHLIFCHPLLLPSVFPSIRVFSRESILCIQSIGASTSASVLPVSIHNWFSLGLTNLISFQSKGLSRVFSNTTVEKYQLFSTQLSLWSNSHPYMTNGKTIALTRQTFINKVMSLFFIMLSRFVIAFLPRNMHLLISWLKSASTVSIYDFWSPPK